MMTSAGRRRAWVRTARLVAGAAAGAVAGIVTAAAARGQATPPGGVLVDSLPRGQVVASITTRADTGERYAVYLPARYDGQPHWPVLLVMDPRGRALVALRLFQEAAERDGYVVLSSYNTLSDSTDEPNTRAINAMLAELGSRFAVDEKRMYLAGMSGTARVAWDYAYELTGHVAGILGFAAGLPWRGAVAYVQLKRPVSFAWFGTAGTADFNYSEVRELDGLLDSLTTIPHRVEFFDGPHGWPPAAICGQALDWMELQAMKTGLRARDDTLLGAWAARDLARAHAAEDSGNVYGAYRRYRKVRDDFGGLRDVAEAEAKVQTLARSKSVREREEREAALAVESSTYGRDAFQAYLADLDGSKHPPSLASALRDLKIRELQRQESDSAHDRLAAQSARRMLALVMANTSFYWPRRYFGANDPTRALAVLDVAHEVEPTAWYVCFEQARAYGLLGRTGDAAASLRCALAGGRLTAGDIHDEHAFDRVRSDAAFAAVAATAPTARPTSPEE
jgi:predicted esterase